MNSFCLQSSLQSQYLRICFVLSFNTILDISYKIFVDCRWRNVFWDTVEALFFKSLTWNSYSFRWFLPLVLNFITSLKSSPFQGLSYYLEGPGWAYLSTWSPTRHFRAILVQHLLELKLVLVTFPATCVRICFRCLFGAKDPTTHQLTSGKTKSLCHKTRQGLIKHQELASAPVTNVTKLILVSLELLGAMKRDILKVGFHVVCINYWWAMWLIKWIKNNSLTIYFPLFEGKLHINLKFVPLSATQNSNKNWLFRVKVDCNFNHRFLVYENFISVLYYTLFTSSRWCFRISKAMGNLKVTFWIH